MHLANVDDLGPSPSQENSLRVKLLPSGVLWLELRR